MCFALFQLTWTYITEILLLYFLQTNSLIANDDNESFVVSSSVANVDNWKGEYSYISCSALLISFEIDCF